MRNKEDSMSKSTKVLLIIMGIIIVVGIVLVLQNGALGQGASRNISVHNAQQHIARHVLVNSDVPARIEVVTESGHVEPVGFYESVAQGDFIAFYDMLDMVVLYRPSVDRIIGTGSIEQVVKEQQQAKSVIAPPADMEVVGPVIIEIRNGTDINGLAGRTANAIRSDVYTISETVNAAHSEYASAVIVNLAGPEKAAALFELADLIGAEIIEALPVDEAASDADIVVILGS